MVAVKNKSEPISIYEIVRICFVWWRERDSNPCEIALKRFSRHINLPEIKEF